jgi:hypothetical protein
LFLEPDSCALEQLPPLLAAFQRHSMRASSRCFVVPIIKKINALLQKG